MKLESNMMDRYASLWDSYGLCNWNDAPKQEPIAKIVYGATTSEIIKLSEENKKKEEVKSMNNKLNKTKTVYSVKFINYDKIYKYFSKVPLEVGAVYDIVADGFTTYKTPVEVISIDQDNTNANWRTITEAALIHGAKRADSGIKEVYFNEFKATTCVLWKDGTKTIIKCQKGDVFDREKALALCYIKKTLGNKSSFNEVLKKYCFPELDT